MKALDQKRLDDLMLETPQARRSYFEACMAYASGRELREVRQALGLTVAEVAERANVAAEVVKKLEGGGTQEATIATMVRIASALNRYLQVRLVEADARDDEDIAKERATNGDAPEVK